VEAIVSEENALLSAIIANPDDPTTWLVYADWLAERGDPRAEYLRLEVELEQQLARSEELQVRLDPRWVRRVSRRRWAEIKLRAGGTIGCQSLQQGSTYAGLLEGLPTRQMNQGTIERLVRTERERGWWVGEPYVVPPVVRPIEYRGGGQYPFGEPEALPGVTCVARFVTHAPNACTAELTVIWFQDQFAFPIAPYVREHLEGIDWGARAIVIEA
jgi:uncharacterized protein (TIGR02996 family)